MELRPVIGHPQSLILQAASRPFFSPYLPLHFPLTAKMQSSFYPDLSDMNILAVGKPTYYGLP